MTPTPKRVVAATIVAILAALVLVAPTAAGLSWCRADPIVRLDGTEVQILIEIPERFEERVTGPTGVRISTPPDVERALISTDPGFNGQGEVVAFGTLGDDAHVDHDTFWTLIQVVVPIATDKTVPVRVIVKPDDARKKVFEGFHDGTEVWVKITGS